MPVKTYPLQPQYDDALTEAGIAEQEGYQLDPNQVPENYTYQQFVPSAQDLQGPALMEQYARAQQEALLAQQMGIDQAKKNLDQMRGQETGVNLSPLMALADAWATGPSNLAQSYKAPMSEREKNAQVMSLQEKLQAARDKQTDNRTQALSAAIRAYSANKTDPQMTRLRESQIAANLAQAGIRQEQASPLGQYKKMPTEAKQKIGFLTEGLMNLTDYEKAYASGGRQSFVNSDSPLIGKALSSTEIDDARRNMQEAIGRLASGGAITKDEVNTFGAMIPTAADTDEASKRKLKGLRRALENKLTGYGTPVTSLSTLGFDTSKMGYGNLQRLQELRKKAGK